MKYLKISIEYVINFILVHLIIGPIYLNSTFGKTTPDEKFFHLLIPVGGVNKDVFISYFLKGILPTIIIALIIIIIRRKKPKKYFYIIFTIISLSFATYSLDIITALKNNIYTSNFIKDNYVDPANTNITFTEKKNLIYIYLESMEVTYSSKEYGGAKKENLIPNLTNYANDNINFSNTELLGGALYLEGSGFTAASMLSQTTGIPLKVNYSKYGKIDYQKYYKGISLGDILYNNGYDNYIIMGSDSTYGARDILFGNHHYQVSDVNTAIKEGKMNKDDIVWWGYSDKDLFKYAKEDLTNISKNNKPFNYTMLTVDTHFEDGYLNKSCKKPYKDQYSNVIKCNDYMLNEFINWIKEQDFYKNTVIILVGDHISMDQTFFDNIDKNYIRTTYNTFINVNTNKTINNKNRQFTNLDLFPTTISAIGGKIEGERLGLGTNLFSTKKTLTEEYKYKYVREELNKRSEFYNSLFYHN